MMKLVRPLAFVMALLSIFAETSAQANDWSVTAHVVSIEVTYMPNQVRFRLDQAAGNCAAGTFLVYNAQGSDQTTLFANGNAIYSTLLTALTANRTVTLYGVNDNCATLFVYIN